MAGDDIPDKLPIRMWSVRAGFVLCLAIVCLLVLLCFACSGIFGRG
jgi:hypothetical protein